MKHLIFVSLLLSMACTVHAKPFYSYNLHGTVTGEASAASLLADVDIGDKFVIRLNIWEYSSGAHQVSFNGRIGSWTFSQQRAVAFYYWGDWSPERFYTSGSYSDFLAPAGNNSTIFPNGLYLTLLGMEQTGTKWIPEENRLIQDTGKINIDRFYSGSFYFWFFSQEAGSSFSTEEDLYGSISHIAEVPEPGTFILLTIACILLMTKETVIKNRVILRKELSRERA